MIFDICEKIMEHIRAVFFLEYSRLSESKSLICF